MNLFCSCSLRGVILYDLVEYRCIMRRVCSYAINDARVMSPLLILLSLFLSILLIRLFGTALTRTLGIIIIFIIYFPSLRA